jgi:hypothetical protein
VNKIPRVVIPLAIVFWLGSILVFRAGVPDVARFVFVAAMVVTIPAAVFWLMAEQGWSTLARQFRAHHAFRGKWQSCPTGQMALVGVDHPEFNRRRLRLVSTLLVGMDTDALHLSTLFSRVPVLNLLFPDVAIPWRAITSARLFEPRGWVAPASEPGALLQLGYDPNYTGRFVELTAGEPPVYLQLPLALLGEPGERLVASR